MKIALVGRKVSTWLDDVAARCAVDCARLDLEAALHDGALTIDDERVLWDGYDLLAADVVLLERPVFSWPQSGIGAQQLSPRADREARALIVSALHAVARSVRVLDPPATARFAVAPLSALDLLERSGLAVHPWQLIAERPQSDERTWFDPAGNDLWLEARAPAPGQPAWSPEPFEEPVLSLLSVGGSVLGARRFNTPMTWSRGEPAERRAASELSAAVRAAARSAQLALELAWLQTDLVEGPAGPRILRVVPGVDLAPWDRELEGGASAAMAALLLDPSYQPAA